MKQIVIFCVLFTLLSVQRAVSVPNLINYQGRLTDSLGSAVPDGSYTIQFRFYAQATGGIPFWSEQATIVASGGLFSHLIGSVTSLPTDLVWDRDELHLELVVDGDVTQPRIRLSTTPFAQSAKFLRVTNSADSVVILTMPDLHQVVWYGFDGRTTVEIEGQRYGLIRLYDSSLSGLTVELSATPDSGGRLSLNPDDADNRVVFSGGIGGDEAAVLPAGAISAVEMLDEPGIVSSINTNQVPLVTGAMTDLVTLSITTPGIGYIVLRGKCYLLLSGTTGPNSALVQIDESEGGSSQFPYYTVGGLSGYVNTGVNYFPVYVTRIYFKSAGTYEFRMEGRATDPAPADARTWDHVLTATYYPTEYGAVKAIIEGTPHSRDAIPRPSGSHADSNSSTVYEVDLRKKREKE